MAKNKKHTKKNSIVKSVGNIALAPMIPLRPGMKKILTKKGVAVPKKISNVDLLTLFYNNIVSPNDKLDSNWYENDKAFFTDEYEYNHMDSDTQDNLVTDIVQILSSVVKWFGNAKEKTDKVKNTAVKNGISELAAAKKEGLQITPSELTGSQVLGNVLGGTGVRGEVGFGANPVKVEYILYIVGLIFIIYFVAKK